MEWLEYCKTFKEKCKANYQRMMGKPLNLENPKTFTEKLQWLKIYDSTFLKSYCTDKILVHDYCISKLGKDICIPIIATYDKPDEINLSKLPNSFVIKCNHGCKMNIIVKDKSKINLNAIKLQLNKWLTTDFSQFNGCELHYKLIKHKILIEEYKENEGHSDLTDYKFYCLNGKPIFCQVIEDRHTHITCSHYDMNWKYAPQYDWIEYHSSPNVKKPAHFEEMIEYAKILSADFKLARSDFYLINDKIYLGEITFTPNSGYHHFVNKDMDNELGNLLKI